MRLSLNGSRGVSTLLFCLGIYPLDLGRLIAEGVKMRLVNHKDMPTKVEPNSRKAASKERSLIGELRFNNHVPKAHSSYNTYIYRCRKRF
ncbi:hypothetical protein F4679DRAFT_383616 [Xylaria curta]|nr:hypothetical protein F4679DRAFT_383616 [Xylaria curta]